MTIFCRRNIRWDTLSSKPEDLEQERSALEQRIMHFVGMQSIFMPGAVAYRQYITSPPTSDTSPLPYSSDDRDDLDPEDHPTSNLSDVKAEVFDLMLPSGPVSVSHRFADESLAKRELKLRLARLEAHLSEIRRLLRIRASVYLDKKANSVGQKSGTRSHMLLTSYNKKIERAHKCYEEERKAALRLDPEGSWNTRLRELKKADVRAAHENENETLREGIIAAVREPGEASRQLSWIWKVPLRSAANAETANTVATQEEISEGESKMTDMCTRTDSVSLQLCRLNGRKRMLVLSASWRKRG